MVQQPTKIWCPPTIKYWQITTLTSSKNHKLASLQKNKNKDNTAQPPFSKLIRIIRSKFKSMKSKIKKVNFKFYVKHY